MKLTNALYGIALTALLGGGLASCSSEMNEPSIDSQKGMLVKAPDVIAYSGDYVFGKSFKTRGGQGVTSEFCKTELIDRNHEKEIIDEWLPEQNGNLKEGINSDFLFFADEDLSLEFYPVFSQTNTQNDLGVFYYDEDGEYHEVIVWANINPWDLTETDYSAPVKDSWVEDPNHWSGQGGYYSQYGVTYSKGVQINVPAGCKFGFFWKGNGNNGVPTTYYSTSSMNESFFRTDGGGNKIEPEEFCQIHAVTFTLEGKTYLGLEDWTDFDFQDWVFTCDKELKTVPSDDIYPSKPEQPGDKDDDNGEEEPDQPAVDTPQAPGHNHSNEVEVNLGVDEKGDQLESHLSIHVRAATDVEVFIPVPVEYYCEADDMAIVMKHEPNHMGHGGPYSYTYTLKDSDLQVTLNVAFENEGIRIWTEGINQEVIDWCAAKCNGDGITFEVWNYFNEVLSLEGLKEYLDQATIKFLDELPDAFINAFGEENFQENKDCWVNIVDEQKGEYDYTGERGHLNGSEHNHYYEKKNSQSVE